MDPDCVQVSAATQAGLALPAGRGSPYSYQVKLAVLNRFGGCMLALTPHQCIVTVPVGHVFGSLVPVMPQPHLDQIVRTGSTRHLLAS